MSSTRYQAHVFPLRPGPGLSPPAIVTNTTRRVSRSGFARCTTPANSRRRLRIVVSALSHRAFLRALAQDKRLPVRCSRWKPIIRTKKQAVPTVEHSEVLHAESPRHTPMQQRFHHPGLNMRTFSMNEAVSTSYSSSLHRSKHVHGSRTRRLISGIVCLVDKVAQVQKMHCLFMPLACCFDDERRGKGCLVRCPQRHGFRVLLRYRETRCFEYVHNDRHHLRKVFR